MTETSAELARLIEAFDQSRMQLSRALHDGAQQQFVNTVLYLRRAELIEPGSGEAAQLRSLALEQAQTGIDGLRHLVTNLYPAILATRGLNTALDALATRVPFRLDLDLADRRLPPATEASIYFLCADALGVLAAHSQLDAASVRTTVQEGQLSVELSCEAATAPDPQQVRWPEVLTHRMVALGGSIEFGRSAADAPVLRARVPLT